MMAEEFENTSQDTQADVKGAGTMLAAPFEIARQDTLLEVQQTVNKTKTTIGELNDPAPTASKLPAPVARRHPTLPIAVWRLNNKSAYFVK